MAVFFFVGWLFYNKRSLLKLYKRKQLSTTEWKGTGKVIPVFDMAPCRKAVWKSGCVILLILTPSTRLTSQLQVPVALLPGIYRTGGLTRPSVFLRIMQERKFLSLCRQSNPHSPTSCPVDWFYTDYSSYNQCFKIRGFQFSKFQPRNLMYVGNARRLIIGNITFDSLPAQRQSWMSGSLCRSKLEDITFVQWRVIRLQMTLNIKE